MFLVCKWFINVIPNKIFCLHNPLSLWSDFPFSWHHRGHVGGEKMSANSQKTVYESLVSISKIIIIVSSNLKQANVMKVCEYECFLLTCWQVFAVSSLVCTCIRFISLCDSVRSGQGHCSLSKAATDVFRFMFHLHGLRRKLYTDACFWVWQSCVLKLFSHEDCKRDVL